MSSDQNENQDGLGEDTRDEGLTASANDQLGKKPRKVPFMLRGIRGKSDKRLIMLVGAIGVLCAAVFIYDATGGTSVHSSAPPAPDTDYVQGTKAPTPEYRKLLEEQDQQRAQQAAKSGGSALPTIIAPSPKTPAASVPPTSPAPDQIAPAQPSTPPAKPILPEAPQNSTGSPPPKTQSVVTANSARVQAMVKEMQKLNSEMSGGSIEEVRFSSGGSVSQQAASRSGSFSGNRAYTGPAAGSTSSQANAQQDPPSSNGTPGSAGPFSAPAPGTRLAAVLGGMNSDAPGPVTGTIEQGPLTGARLLGTAQTTREGAAIRFTSMTVPYRTASGQLTTQTVSINAWAISPANGTTDVATSVNHHLAEQLAVAFTTSLLGNFGQLIANSGASTVINPSGAIAVTNPALSTTKQLASAAGTAAGTAGSLFQQIYGNRPTTIKVAPGTPCTLLFVGGSK